MMNGILLKGIGGFYYVETTDGVIECKARGVFRKDEVSPFVGDNVIIEITDTTSDGTKKGVIAEISSRKNSFVRPPLANIDAIIFVVSVLKPAPNFFVLDKLIAICEYKGIEPVIVITKSDISEDESITEIYKKAGFTVLSISKDDNQNLDELKAIMCRKIVAFIGNSGVGKSTLLNSVNRGLNLETAEISEKLGRGKHTTRQVELFKTDENSYIADTPGFSDVEIGKYETILKENLADCFREFLDYTPNCKFTNCSHTIEKSCAVVKAVNSGEISQSRHQSYINMYENAKKIKEWE